MKNFNYYLLFVIFGMLTLSCSARQTKEQANANEQTKDTIIQNVVNEPIVEAEEINPASDFSEEIPETSPVKEQTTTTSTKEEKTVVQKQEIPVATPNPAPIVEAASKPVVEEPVVITFYEGSVLPISLSSTLSTDAIQPGGKFSGILQMDVISDEGYVLPEGAKVQGKIISVTKGGRLVGQSSIVLELTFIKINNRYHPLVTDQLVLQSEKSGKKTLRNAGVGAAVGAAVDGGSGAGKGAAIMGGLQLLTNKGGLQIPAGFALNFTLAQPLSYED